MLPAAASGAGVAGASAASRILITSPRAGGPRSSVARHVEAVDAMAVPLSAVRLVRPTITWAASRSMKNTQVTDVTTTRLAIRTPVQDSTSPKMSVPSTSTTDGWAPAGTAVPPVDRGVAAEAGATAQRTVIRARRVRRITGGYRRRQRTPRQRPSSRASGTVPMVGVK